MLKARGKMGEHDTLFLGLSYGNLKRFKDKPLDTFIRIDKGELGMPFDVLIFSGRTEAELESFLLSHTTKQ